MSDLLDTIFNIDAVWPWLVLLPLAIWFAWFVYRRTRPSVSPSRVTLLWMLRGASFSLLLLLLAEPMLSYLSRRALRPVTVTLIDTSPSMDVEQEGVTRLARFQRALAGELGEHLDGPTLAFSSTAYDIDGDTLDQLKSIGQATDLAAALHAGVRAVPDPHLLAGILLLSDGRHNLGEDPERVATQLGTPIYTLGLGSQHTPDDVQIVEAVPTGPVFAGRPARILLRLRSWGFQDSTVVIRIAEGDDTLREIEFPLGTAGQQQQVELSVPSLSAGPHLLRVSVVPRDGELPPHNNQVLVSLRVRHNRLRVLMSCRRPGAESAFIGRTLTADSTLQIDEFIGRGDGGFYGSEPFPQKLAAYDALILLDEVPATIAPGDLQMFVAEGGGLLLQKLAPEKGGLSAELEELLPTIAGPRTSVRGQEPLRLGRDASSHAIGRFLVGRRQAEAAGDPWQRLPPLLLRLPRLRAKPVAHVLLAASDGDPVVVAGAFGAGRIIQIAGTGFWRQSLFGGGGGGDQQTVRRFWRSAIHWLAVAEPGGRVRASSEPIYRSGEPAVVTVEVFDELNEPLTDAQVELLLAPGGRLVSLDPQAPGRYRAEIAGLDVGTHSFRVTARYGDTDIGQNEGSFIVESHTLESADLRGDAEMLAAIARASGGAYRELGQWAELSHLLRPLPVLVEEEQRLGVEVRHLGWLILLTGLLAAEWILRKRSGML